ncbi:MAG: hypothetical protein KBS81_09750 [Spirochaetales bacterium]|nr:hypothetical protein [Candidatus Physcosoma equi]
MKKERRELSEKMKNRLAFLTPLLVIFWFYLFNKLVFEFGTSPNLKSVGFGAVLLLMGYTFLSGILGKLQWATIVSASIFVVFTMVNCIKLYFTNDPILFSDFKYLNDFREIICIVDSSFTFSFVTVILPSLVFGFSTGFLVWRMRKCRFTVRRLWVRLLMVLLPFCLFLQLLHPTPEMRSFFLKNIYGRTGTSSDRTFTSNLRQYGVNGIASGMYYHYLENKLTPPEGYDEERMTKLAEGIERQTEGKFGQPNLIVYFSESNFDIHKLQEVQFNRPINGNYQKLKEEGMGFEFVSHSFGGVT